MKITSIEVAKSNHSSSRHESRILLNCIRHVFAVYHDSAVRTGFSVRFNAKLPEFGVVTEIKPPITNTYVGFEL